MSIRSRRARPARPHRGREGKHPRPEIFRMRAFLGLTWTLAIASGCGGKPPVESMLLASFTKPASRQLSGLDKSNISAPGFPVDVEVEGQDTGGRAIELASATLEIRLPNSPDWSAGPDPQLNGPKATFPNVPLAAGVNGLRVTIAEKPSLRTALSATELFVATGTGCLISITAPGANPFTFNISTNQNPLGTSLQYTLQGVSSNCPGVPATLSKGAPTQTVLGTGTASTAGAFSIPFTLADGERTRLTAQMTDPFPPNPVTSASLDVTVKLTPPSLSSVIPVDSTLFFVADTNVHLLSTDGGYVSSNDAGYVINKGPTDSAAVADFGFTVANAAGGTARLVYNGVDVSAPIPITSDPQTVVWPNAILPPKSAGSLQFRARDSAANETIRTANATIDVIPPAASSFVDAGLAPDGGRTASVNLQWTASGDDGLDGGPAAGYDLRWSTTAVIPADAGFDAGTYFDQNKFSQSPGGLLPGGTRSKLLTPLPPLNTYLFQVRPVDAVGNYARQSPQASVDNFWTQVTLANPDIGLNGYGVHMAAADLNADGFDDLVVASPCLDTLCNTTRTGTVYVYYGSSTNFGGAATRQDLTPGDGQIRFYGADVSAGNASHAASDPVRNDLLVGQPSWHFGTAEAGRGRAFLYFGRSVASGPATLNPSTAIEFRGTGAGTQFGAAARIIGDINGDGIGEILISAPIESGFAGRVYLFYGRNQAQWAATVASQTPDPDGVRAIPTSAADRVFTPAPGDTYFGRLDGYAYLGNLGGGTGASFTVPNSLDTINKLYLYSGNMVNGRVFGATIASTDALQVIRRPTAVPVDDFGGFGSRAFGNVNLIQGLFSDLVVTHPKESKIYLFPDGTSAGFNGAPYAINGSAGSNLGHSLAYGDFNQDGRMDIVSGENPGANSSAWLFFNHGVMGGGFDTTAGAGFNQSRLFSPTALGIDVAVGDFNGDGKPDLAAADNLDGSGKVTVWY